MKRIYFLFVIVSFLICLTSTNLKSQNVLNGSCYIEQFVIYGDTTNHKIIKFENNMRISEKRFPSPLSSGDSVFSSGRTSYSIEQLKDGFIIKFDYIKPKQGLGQYDWVTGYPYYYDCTFEGENIRIKKTKGPKKGWKKVDFLLIKTTCN